MRKTGKVGDWASQCCREDAMQIITPEELDDVMQSIADTLANDGYQLIYFYDTLEDCPE